MTSSEQSKHRAGTAYTVAGGPIDVDVDTENRTFEVSIDGHTHTLNLGHLEQLDNAVRRALIWLALHPQSDS